MHKILRGWHQLGDALRGRKYESDAETEWSNGQDAQGKKSEEKDERYVGNAQLGIIEGEAVNDQA